MKGTGSLKDQISVLKPILEDLRLKKKERVEEFSGIQSQIAQICGEIAGNGDQSKNEAIRVNVTDLTVKKLEELKLHLKELLHEKVPFTTVTMDLDCVLSCITYVLILFVKFISGFAHKES